MAHAEQANHILRSIHDQRELVRNVATENTCVYRVGIGKRGEGTGNIDGLPVVANESYSCLYDDRTGISTNSRQGDARFFGQLVQMGEQIGTQCGAIRRGIGDGSHAVTRSMLFILTVFLVACAGKPEPGKPAKAKSEARGEPGEVRLSPELQKTAATLKGALNMVRQQPDGIRESMEAETRFAPRS